MGPTQMPAIGRHGGDSTRPANKAGGGTSSGLIERCCLEQSDAGPAACTTRPRNQTTTITIFSAGPLSVSCMCCLDRWHPFWRGAGAECGIIGCTHVFHGVILYVGGEQQQRQPKHCGLRLRGSTGWVATCNKSAGGGGRRRRARPNSTKLAHRSCNRRETTVRSQVSTHTHTHTHTQLGGPALC